MPPRALRPVLVPPEIAKRIRSVEFMREGANRTICAITLDNGFLIRADSLSSGDRFDPEYGEALAADRAKAQLLTFFQFVTFEQQFQQRRQPHGPTPSPRPAQRPA